MIRSCINKIRDSMYPITAFICLYMLLFARLPNPGEKTVTDNIPYARY